MPVHDYDRSRLRERNNKVIQNIYREAKAYIKIKGESSEFFQIPEPRGTFGIFPSFRTDMEETVRIVIPSPTGCT